MKISLSGLEPENLSYPGASSSSSPKQFAISTIDIKSFLKRNFIKKRMTKSTTNLKCSKSTPCN